MGSNVAGIQTNQKREQVTGPPFAATAADNGLSVDPVTGHIVLGQDPGAPGDPAMLLAFRDIPSPGFAVEFRVGAFGSGMSCALSAITDGNGATLAAAFTQTAPGLPVVVRIDNQGGPALGAFVQFNVDNGSAFFGVFGQLAGFPAYMRNSVGIWATSVTTPDVILATSQSAPNVPGFVKFSYPILGVDTEVYRFLAPVSAVLDFPNTLAQTSSDLTIAVPGARVNDTVWLGAPAPPANSHFTAFVSAANTVTVRFINFSAAAIDPASGTFKVGVVRIL